MSRKNSLSSVHKFRYIRAKVEGRSLEDVAREDGVSITTIERSILSYELYRAAHGPEEVMASQAEIVLHSTAAEKFALAEALAATRTEGYEVRVVKVNGDSQEEEVVQEAKEVPDHEVRLHASEILTQKATLFAPKSKVGTTVNVGVGVQGAGAPSVTLSYEDRLRKLTAKRQQMLNAAPEEEIPEAEVVQAEPEAVVSRIPLN